jgi:hypothetical protein
VTTPPTPFTLSRTAVADVPLFGNGEFKIDDMLLPVPPFDCVNPMLLIRNATNGGWFTFGFLRTGDDD